MIYARNRFSLLILRLPYRRDVAARAALRPAENARYPLLPLLRLISREMVAGSL